MAEPSEGALVGAERLVDSVAAGVCYREKPSNTQIPSLLADFEATQKTVSCCRNIEAAVSFLQKFHVRL
jgi:hypothetical protein